MVDGVEFTGEKKQQGTSNNQQPQQQRPQQQQQQPAPQYTPHNALEAGQSWGNLSDFEEILSDGDVPF
jgi:single-strand DNA-binding protein